MIRCEKCNRDVIPSAELQSDMRVVHVCPICSSALQGVPDVVTSTLGVRPDVAEARKPKKQDGPPRAVPVTVRPALQDVDIISQIRERLAFVESQIRDVRALESEAAMLRLMLEVAGIGQQPAYDAAAE